MRAFTEAEKQEIRAIMQNFSKQVERALEVGELDMLTSDIPTFRDIITLQYVMHGWLETGEVRCSE